MDGRVERLDPAVHHLRETGKIANIAHGETGVAERPGGAAGRDQLDTPFYQGACQFYHAGLVGDGQQRAADRDGGHGAALWPLSRRASRAS